MNVLLVGPYETKGRYEGGISYIVNTITSEKKLYHSQNLKIKKFDTCRVERKMTDQGKLSVGNIKNTLSIIKNIKKVIKKSHPDVIYYNSSYGLPLLKDLVVLWLAGCKKSTKVILHIHFADVEKILPADKRLAYLTLDLIKKAVNHVVFLSKKTQRAFIEFGLKESQTSVLYNFHNIEMTEDEVRTKIENFENRNDVLELIFMGSIDERKGIIDLLTALKKVHIPYHLSICGKPINKDIEKKMQEIIKNLPDNSVDVLGFISGNKKEELLKKANILILPSYGEGFPIVLLEGIATANIIITTNVGAIPEVFDEKNGAVIKAGDVDKLAESIITYSQDNSIVMYNNYLKSKGYNVGAFVEKMSKICECVVNE